MSLPKLYHKVVKRSQGLWIYLGRTASCCEMLWRADSTLFVRTSKSSQSLQTGNINGIIPTKYLSMKRQPSSQIEIEMIFFFRVLSLISAALRLRIKIDWVMQSWWRWKEESLTGFPEDQFLISSLIFSCCGGRKDLPYLTSFRDVSIQTDKPPGGRRIMRERMWRLQGNPDTNWSLAPELAKDASENVQSAFLSCRERDTHKQPVLVHLGIPDQGVMTGKPGCTWT